jgi:AraC-like DNA-binding protein
MKFDKFIPTEELKPHITYFVVSENECENEYKVLPSTGLVMGFQYGGQLSRIERGLPSRLDTAGITGMTDSYMIFKSLAGTGTILVYFTETGFTHFASQPANELFNLSLSLNDIFENVSINQVEEKLAFALTDIQRIEIVEKFLLSQLKEIPSDRLIAEAVNLIYQSKGAVRIRELTEKLFISQSPFEKRFRKIVGTTPKKFTSIVRFNAVLARLNETKSVLEICYEHNFFDQAHFIKDFKQFTGDTPESFKRLL